MRKQYIAWALLFCLLPGICINVHAADEALTINLLNAVEFVCHTASPVPSFNLVAEDHARITWSTIIPYRCEKFVLGIYSSSDILNISFNGIVGTQIGKNGYYYQFEFINGDDVLTGSTACTLDIDLMQEQEQNINLVSFFGYQSNYIEVDQVNYLLLKQYRVIDHSMLKTSIIKDAFGRTLPFDEEYYMTSWAGTPERLLYGINYINVDPSSLGVSYLDSMQFQYTHSGVDYYSVSIIDKSSGDVICVPDSYTFNANGGFLTTMQGFSQYEVNLYHGVVHVDLSGIDLSNAYIQFYVGLEALVWGASTENQEGFYFRADWCRAVLPDEDLPWYTVWGNWIKNQFSAILNWFEIVEAAIVEGFNSLINFLKNGFQDVLERLDELVSSLTPDSSGVDNAVDDMGGMADEFDDANDYVATVPRPEFDDPGMDFDSYVDIDSVGPNAAFLTVLVNQPTIKSLMMISLILAAAAYVFFGKRL